MKKINRYEDGSVEIERVPDQYRSGRGYLIKPEGKSIRITEEWWKQMQGAKSSIDDRNYRRVIDLCFLSCYSKQRLAYRYNSSGDTRGMDIRRIEKILGISRPTARAFLKWCKEKDILREDEDTAGYVVNPNKIQIGSRVEAREYWTYRDVLERRIPYKYRRLLSLEANDGEVVEE